MTTPIQRPDGRFDDAEIIRSLPCCRCRYDIRGLRLGSRCPECGEEVWETVARAIDPAAYQLPVLRNPVRVGDGLLLLTLWLFIAMILLTAPSLAMTADQLFDPVGRFWTLLASPMLYVLAGFVLLLGVPTTIMLAPPRGREPRGAVWRDIRLLVIAFAAWSALSLVRFVVETTEGFADDVAQRTARAAVNLCMAMIALLLLATLRRVFRIIGDRSRAYRTARGGRQRVRDLMFACFGYVLGEITRLLGILLAIDWLAELGQKMMWVVLFMLVIGGVYLLVNAWWIRRALRRPPPILRELIAIPAEAEAGDPSEPDQSGHLP